MSSVRLVPAWRLPVAALTEAPKRRRILVVAGAFLLLAAAAVVMVDPARFVSRPGSARKAPIELAAARARAVARASEAAARARLSPPPAKSVAQGRVVEGATPAALFASHSWYVAPPPPPAVAAAPPPPPAAPPFPYTFVGSYAPAGEKPVFFLARADRVIDAHLGDRLDGVFEFEKVEAGQLIFNYLPLNIRQSLPAGVIQ